MQDIGLTLQWQKVSKHLSDTNLPLQFAERWGVDAGTLRLVNAGFNFVFRFEAQGAGRYLRIAHPAFHDRAKVLAATDYLRHLSAQHAPVCIPVASRNGQFLEEIYPANAPEQMSEPKPIVATVVTEAPGEPLGLEHTASHVYTAWGRSLGLLHNAAQSFVAVPEHRYLGGEEIWEHVAGWIQPDDEPARMEYKRVEAWYQTIRDRARTPAEWGLTHADYRPGNVLWDGANAVTVDFDEPNLFWYASDAARALLEFWDRPAEMRQRFRDWFVMGYRSVRPLSDFWVEALPWLMRMKLLDLYAWSPDDPDALALAAEPNAPREDEFQRKTRQRFLNPEAW